MNRIPIVGWLISFGLNASLSVPFWICWTACGLGETYFSFLPRVWQRIPFWHCVGLFIVFEIVRSLAPKFVSTTQNVEKE